MMSNQKDDNHNTSGTSEDKEVVYSIATKIIEPAAKSLSGSSQRR